MLFDTLAVTGGKPNASSVGKVVRVPEPTTALMAPAATPARAMARISYQGTGRPYKRAGRGPAAGPGAPLRPNGGRAERRSLPRCRSRVGGGVSGSPAGPAVRRPRAGPPV